MHLEIHSSDGGLLSALFEGVQPEIGMRTEPVPSVGLIYAAARREHGIMEALNVVEIVVSVPTAVGAGLFANWLWEKLATRKIQKVVVDRTVVEFTDKQGLLRIIKEKTATELK